MKINKKIYNQISKLMNKKGSIDLKDFKSIVGVKKEKKKNEFLFNCEVKQLNENDYLISFVGKHYAKNVIQTWHRGILLKYKKAIKEAAKNGFLTFYSNNPEFKKLDKVKILIKVYNPRSRDDDANYDTLKWLRDTFTFNHFILDDNRKVILDSKEVEIISKEWKVEFLITKVN